jgi:hypothetical protein
MAGEVLERKRGGYQGFRLETEFSGMLVGPILTV